MQQPSAEPAGTDSEAAEPPWVLPLTDISASRLAEVGGKALHLAELLRGGFRVPPGFCLTSTVTPDKIPPVRSTARPCS